MTAPAPTSRQLELLGEIAVERKWVGFARQFLPTEEEAEDAVQEAVIRSLPSLHRMYTTPGQSRRWWATMLRWTCINRAQRRRPDSLPLEDLEGLRAEPAAPSAADVLIHREELQCLLDAVADLPADRREVLEMALDGITGSESAARLGVSEKAFKSRLWRLRADLKAQVRAAS